jgi:uncharacterized protein (UPF0305 family)
VLFRSDGYYCLIRDKEKDVFYSICNFCPATQADEPERAVRLVR